MDRLKRGRLAAAAALAVATLTAPPANSRNPSNSGENTMMSAAERWGEAFNKGDLDAVVALYTEDAELLPKGTQAIRGHAAIRSYLRDLLASKPQSQRTIFTHVQSFGGGDAVSEVADVEIEDGQGNRTVLGRQILVLLKQGGQWRVHRDMWTNNDQPGA